MSKKGTQSQEGASQPEIVFRESKNALWFFHPRLEFYLRMRSRKSKTGVIVGVVELGLDFMPRSFFPRRSSKVPMQSKSILVRFP